jgi:hypothetical protein
LGRLLFAAVGCSRSPLETVPIDGLVTFAGGPPPARGAVYFRPLETAEGLPSRPAHGDFDEQGVFKVYSLKRTEGLVPGKYSVQLECWKQSPDATGVKGVSFVPVNFRPSDVEVPRGQTEPLVVRINVPAGVK